TSGSRDDATIGTPHHWRKVKGPDYRRVESLRIVTVASDRDYRSGRFRERQAGITRPPAQDLELKVVRVLPDDVAYHGIILVLGHGQDSVDKARFALELTFLPLVIHLPREVALILEGDRDRRIRGRLSGPGPRQLALLARRRRADGGRRRRRRGSAGLGDLIAGRLIRRLLELLEELCRELVLGPEGDEL